MTLFVPIQGSASNCNHRDIARLGPSHLGHSVATAEAGHMGFVRGSHYEHTTAEGEGEPEQGSAKGVKLLRLCESSRATIKHGNSSTQEVPETVIGLASCQRGNRPRKDDTLTENLRKNRTGVGG